MTEIELYEFVVMVSLTSSTVYLGYMAYNMRGINNSLKGIYRELEKLRKDFGKDKGLEKKMDE